MYSSESDDLDFTDNLSHTREQIQMKTTSVAAASTPLGLNMHKRKSKILKQHGEHRRYHTLWQNSGRCAISNVPGKHHR